MGSGGGVVSCWEGGGLLSWVTVIGGGVEGEVVTCSLVFLSLFSKAAEGASLVVSVGTLRSGAGVQSFVLGFSLLVLSNGGGTLRTDAGGVCSLLADCWMALEWKISVNCWSASFWESVSGPRGEL